MSMQKRELAHRLEHIQKQVLRFALKATRLVLQPMPVATALLVVS